MCSAREELGLNVDDMVTRSGGGKRPPFPLDGGRALPTHHLPRRVSRACAHRDVGRGHAHRFIRGPAWDVVFHRDHPHACRGAFAYGAESAARRGGRRGWFGELPVGRDLGV